MVAVLLVGVSTGIRAERWRRLIAHSGGRIGAAESYGLTVVGFMGNTVLPARGGDALRVVLGRSRSRLDARSLIGTLLAERLLDVAILLTAFVVLAYGVLRGVDTPGVGSAIVLAGVIGAAALLVGAVYASRTRRRWARALVDFVAPMVTASRELTGRHGLAMAALTAAVWTAEVAVWFAAALATGLDVSVLEAAYLVAVAAIFVLIPAGPGFAGTLDAGVLFGVGAVGGSGGAALSYLLVLRFVLFVPLTLAGAALMVFRYGGTRALSTATERA